MWWGLAVFVAGMMAGAALTNIKHAHKMGRLARELEVDLIKMKEQTRAWLEELDNGR